MVKSEENPMMKKKEVLAENWSLLYDFYLFSFVIQSILKENSFDDFGYNHINRK